jgi:PAS domain S-box-containing protein
MYRIDLTPSAFTVSGLAMAWGLFRLRLFDIIPMARDAVIENISDGVIVLDTQNRLIDINPAAQRIIGYSLSDVIGQPFARVLPQQPELVEHSNVRMVEALLEIVIEEGETRYYYESHISPIHDRRGRLTGRFVILHDVTEHKLIEARRKELEDRAHVVSRLSTLGEMAAGIAHEISNPLASVIGYANWLLERDIPDDIKGDLEVINRGAKRAGDILDRLLTFAGQRHVEWDYLDINRILEIAIEFRKHSLLNNNIEVIKQFDRGLPKTTADGGQLQEVFLNLIINAETSMTESHGGGKLIIKTETANDNIRICFKDDGAGISEGNINKIFNPFFTTKEMGKGTGLGLSICHGIITEHGGRIYAESELGKGATFIIELPVSMVNREGQR